MASGYGWMIKMKENEIEKYGKKIQKLTDHLDDNSLLGYSEAILNLLGIFTNDRCEDCPFSFEPVYYHPDFIYPEYDLKCKLEKCWIDSIKELFGDEKYDKSNQNITMRPKDNSKN
jgi:hypothetical protein